MKKYLLFVFLASIIAISASAVGKVRAEGKQLLFTQIAQSATLVPVKGQDNVYTLTLNDINQHVIWFTDRPNRDSGIMSIDRFVANWTKGGSASFANDPPNASLVTIASINKMPDAKEVSVFKLSNPVYDKKLGSLTYTATPVGPVHPNHLSQDSLQGEVAVFIDDDPFNF